MRLSIAKVFRAALAASLLGGAAGVRTDFGAGTGAPAPFFFEEEAAAADFVPLNNIFNPTKGQKATFRFVLDTAGHVTLQIYTRVGTLVATLVDGEYPVGTSSVNWNGTNRAGDTVASGVYLARLIAPNLIRTEKVVVLK